MLKKLKRTIFILALLLGLGLVWGTWAEIRGARGRAEREQQKKDHAAALAEKAEEVKALKGEHKKKIDAADIETDSLRARVEALLAAAQGDATITGEGELRSDDTEVIRVRVPCPEIVVSSEEPPPFDRPPGTIPDGPARITTVDAPEFDIVFGKPRLPFVEITDPVGDRWIVAGPLELDVTVGLNPTETVSFDIPDGTFRVASPPVERPLPRTLLGVFVGAGVRSCSDLEVSVPYGDQKGSRTRLLDACGGEGSFGYSVGAMWLPKAWASSSRWAEGRLGLGAEWTRFGDTDAFMLKGGLLFGVGKRTR
jgi:hypothetical protein